MGSREMSRGIPSGEDFARASAVLARRSRGLSDVRTRILERFKPSGEVHEFFILDCSERTFRAYVFFPRERDIQEAEKSGLEARIRAAVMEELARVGRGTRSTADLAFELDSHENVERKFGGDYFNRLR